MGYADYMDRCLVAWEYFMVLWAYLPWIVYAFSVCTLVPKSWRRIRSSAEAELKDVKFHRCYGADRCCHPLEEEEVVRPRRKILRRLPIRRESHEETPEPVPQSPSITPPRHVNQIAKIFENNARKVNRVTPIVTMDSEQDQQSNEALPKKVTGASEDGKYEKWMLKNLEERFFKPPVVANTPTVAKLKKIPMNDENSVNLLNRQPEAEITVEVRKRYSSTSPSPPPRPIMRTPSRPTSLKASAENIFPLASLCSKGSCSPSGPVTSIDEILAQRRFSRPLSEYSITDLLGDSSLDESAIEAFFGNISM